jgi:hypothetical protein
MNKILIFLLGMAVCLADQESGSLSDKTTEKEVLLVFSIPKSGTHLLFKCLDLLNDRGSGFSYKIKWRHPGYRPYGMSSENDQEEQELYNNRSKKILNIRDVRDCICSSVFFLDRLYAKDGCWVKGKSVWENLKTVEEKIEYLIRLEGALPWNHIQTYTESINTSSLSDIFITRFEELVGEHMDAQRSLIRNLASFLEIDLSEEDLTYVQNNLFGPADDPKKRLVGSKDGPSWSSFYFNKGKTGAWKTFFTERHKKLLKNVQVKCLSISAMRKRVLGDISIGLFILIGIKL